MLPGDFSLLNCSSHVNSSSPLTGVINLKLHPWTHFTYTRTPWKSWSLRLETGGYRNGAHFIWPSSARLLKSSLILRNIILLRLRNWKLSILEHTSNPSLWWAEVGILCVPGHTWIYSEFIANPVYKRPHFNSFLLHKQQQQKNKLPRIRNWDWFFYLLANWAFLLIFTFNSSIVTI